MGCGASVSPAPEPPLEPEQLEASAAHLLIREEDGQRVCEAAIYFKEPARSFDSMAHKLSKLDTILPPVAATHDHHVAKMRRFMSLPLGAWHK
ncbi:unnamed protein product [Effrenium voratum]|uniref:Uncharacterized protein n=1 Tax=Effrenium voratum TaxID=2562239 RepID=A0AA36MW70_9DINO|nr:unnamed protein product [Effrenium voratum]